MYFVIVINNCCDDTVQGIGPITFILPNLRSRVNQWIVENCLQG